MSDFLHVLGEMIGTEMISDRLSASGLSLLNDGLADYP